MPEFDRRQSQTDSSHLVNTVRPDWVALQPARIANPTPASEQLLGNQAAQRFARSCPLKLPSPSVCPFGGVCHSCPARVQAKLKIGQPGDKYEQEADRVADAMMRMPDPASPERAAASTPGQGLPIQRAYSDCDDELRLQPAEEEQEEKVLQMKGTPGQALEAAPGLSSRMRGLKGGGRPLPGPVRAYFEPRFGHDFSHVHIHTDGNATEAARAVNARAFTLGGDIVLGSRQYAPSTTAGRRLLAHELTHVIQQRNAGTHEWLQLLTAEEKQADLQSERLRYDVQLQQAYDNSPPLRKQARGEGVKTLQRALRDLGYPLPISFKSGDADGIYGDETERAVYTFQTDHGLERDGVAGRETLGKLDELFLTQVTLQSIRFLSDHSLMRNNRTTWGVEGLLFPKPEWVATEPSRRASPISHTRNMPVRVQLEVDVTPETAANVPYTIRGESSLDFLRFVQSGVLRGGLGQVLNLDSLSAAPDEVNAFPETDIDWSVETGRAPEHLAQSRAHEVFVTLHEPIGHVTYKRMKKATQLCSGQGTNEHAIVTKLNSHFGKYEFCGAECNLHGNAWPLADRADRGQSGECQAIVRFVKGVIEMVGIGGGVTLTIYATPSEPDKPLPSYLDDWRDQGGMRQIPKQPGTGYQAWLFDRGGNSNAYEACLLFKGLYYPGGLGGASTEMPRDILFMFREMSWAERDEIGRKDTPMELIYCYHPPRCVTPRSRVAG